MAKMQNKWVMLCSAAIAAVYGTGYFTTEHEADRLAEEKHAHVHIGKGSKKDSNMSASPQVKAKSMYKEGIFTGIGENRRGSIEVAVTIKKDKIIDVEIRNFAMHYSETDIEGLPDEVLKSQSAQTTNVSGATYSTEAFQDAVQEALSLARNA
ncbi:FMN-binding protein [Peribacillus kribbensis]|uniref:FMN-binding protein n=1 Tax=Peribacillus kribbensis TaxID=356658 RepID=UPI000414CFC0|nr:FMN-binding protein [Peribacillus kribbensis]